MNVEELRTRVTDALGLPCALAFGQLTVDVPRADWARVVALVKEDVELSCDFFDQLTAVDELAAGLHVVLQLWSTARRHGLTLRTSCPADDPVVPSLSSVFAGAAWHERETAEMFGIDFTGHPALSPLLLSADFEGHPLRKSFVLQSRVVKAWPGDKEPGGSP
ncbi:MAG: NADH-quinone oxidoreductase subunit C [Actinomycetota bacterium]|nr:NADH-quinone oxidoreductase subunit C [Actinomycetota bacterium]